MRFVRILLALGIVGYVAYIFIAPKQIHSPTLAQPVVTSEATTTIVSSIATTSSITTNTISTSTKPLSTKKTPQKVALSTTTTPMAKQPTQPEPSVDYEAINAASRPALVNILCDTQGNSLSAITGSGVIIDSSGIILTNAHIGQYWLLKDFPTADNVECVIRTGSPAVAKYRATLVYISPAWVQANKDLLTKTDPTGTGESDFSFLKITDTIDGSPLPGTFPFILPSTRENIQSGEYAVLASYPAGFLGGLSIVQGLFITSAIAQIGDIYTFASSTIDLISVPDTVVSQRGSSGGAVVDKYGRLLGIISTSSAGGAKTSDRDLRAITLPYVSRALQTELKVSLQTFLNSNLDNFAENFNKTTAKVLANLIETELVKKK